MVDNNTTKTNNIQNNGTINTGDPSEDEGEGRKKMSTKEWITKAFAVFLQGDHKLSSSPIIMNSLENIENREKRLDKDKTAVASVSIKSDKCSNQEKYLEQQEEVEQGMHNLVATGATD
ncbi:hypothetical protein H5410_039855 [Solanum commersonii]|uniref:Uncharacterized protein n=1 Tax=Solanum commersonii TaxID=4109 RepID=A0A9J5XND1_SOLCO|nr:hypothetical protein H5410_039855 [Solanum commersonii]